MVAGCTQRATECAQVGTDVALGALGVSEKCFLRLSCVISYLIGDLVAGIVECLRRRALLLLKLVSDLAFCCREIVSWGLGIGWAWHVTLLSEVRGRKGLRAPQRRGQ